MTGFGAATAGETVADTASAATDRAVARVMWFIGVLLRGSVKETTVPRGP
jgi:hypothetical protein